MYVILFTVIVFVVSTVAGFYHYPQYNFRPSFNHDESYHTYYHTGYHTGSSYNHGSDYDYKNAQCIQSCMGWTENYWHRICANSNVKIWCYPQDTLRIIRAEYGNLPCRPSNKKYHGTPRCKAPSSTILSHVKQYCENKNQCLGRVNANLLSGGRQTFHVPCRYTYQSNFYVRYDCKPTRPRCVAYCQCIKHQRPAVCKKANRAQG